MNDNSSLQERYFSTKNSLFRTKILAHLHPLGTTLPYQQLRPVRFARDKLNARLRSAPCAITTLKGFMATTNYTDTSIAITQLLAKFEYARIIWQTVRFSRQFHSLTAKHVGITKTYGANYIAAAHLQRTHFYPCKDRRGGRTKASESRGGTGGGEEPPLSILMDRRYETVFLILLFSTTTLTHCTEG